MPSSLPALPDRRALVEEGVHALAKILAHIGLQDQVLALFARQRAADAAHGFLGRLQRERRYASRLARRKLSDIDESSSEQSVRVFAVAVGAEFALATAVLATTAALVHVAPLN